MAYYILDSNHNILLEPDVAKFGQWFSNNNNRVVAKDNFKDRHGNEVKVSTMFLGIDHSFSQNRPPILFETMIFGGDFDQDTYRYSTWDEAVKGHKKALMKAHDEKDGALEIFTQDEV